MNTQTKKPLGLFLVLKSNSKNIYILTGVLNNFILKKLQDKILQYLIITLIFTVDLN